MKLKEQKKFAILYLILGAALTAGDLLWGNESADAYWSGFGAAFLAIGAARLLRVRRLQRNPEKAAEYEAALTDERTAYVAEKARNLAFFLGIYGMLAGALAAILLFHQSLVGQVLVAVSCGLSLLYTGCYWYYSKRY